MRLLPCGDMAVLVELDDAAQRRRLDEELRRRPIAGVLEHVPAARTVLIKVRASTELPAVATAVRARLRDAEDTGEDNGQLVEHRQNDTGAHPSADPSVTIPVIYDGPDLQEVAHHLGVAPEEVVAGHTGQVWTVEFAGFAPGFGYLIGDKGGLDVPRRESPRTRIPQGAVGLAGPYTGVYPRPSPGGWQLIGSTDEVMWDPAREPPGLFAPGVRVRFTEQRGDD